MQSFTLNMLYKDIPEEFLEYIGVTEDVYNSLPENIQEMAVREAERSYLEDHLDDDDIVEVEDVDEDENVDVVVEDGESSVGNNGRWKYRRVMVTFVSPLHVTPANIESLGNYMDRLRIQYTTGRYIPVQYTLSIMEFHENTLPDSTHMISVVTSRLEEYDGNFTVDSLTITYKKGFDRRRYHGGIVAGSGEGIPRYIKDGYWELDLFLTKKKCIPNSYTLWMMYKNGELDNVIKGDRKMFMEMRKHVDVNDDDIRITDVVKDGKFDIVYEDNLDGIKPSDTKKVCWFVYYNNHVGLLVHERYLQSDSVKVLHKLSNKTVTQRIRPKKKNATPIEIVAADMEMFRRVDDVNVRQHIPRLVGHWDKNREYTYFRGADAVEKYMKHLVDSKRDWLIWFHNGGKYDAHFFLKPMIKHLDKSYSNPAEMRDLKGKLIEITFHLANGYSVVFRDSMSLIPGALKKLTKDMNVTRKKDNLVDILEVTEEELDTCPLVLEYHKADCQGLYELLEKYQKTSTTTFGTNPLHHVSGSSFAKRIFFSSYYQEKYPLYVLSKKTHDFIARGYGGGRNEANRRGIFSGVPIIPYDFTSHYPAVGRMLIPYGVPKWIAKLEHIRMKDMDKFLDNNPGFYELTVLSSPWKKHPLHGTFHDHKYIFPYFKDYEGLVIFSEEIRLGIKMGYKYKLKCGYTQKLAPICKKFFEKMISVKIKAAKEGQKATEYSSKITANSGYGFYGFDPYDRTVMKMYSERMVDHLISMEHNSQLSYRKEEDVYICSERTNVLLPDINVSVAAAITSYARMKLWELIQDILDEGGIVYYYDTDSVYSSIDIVKHPRLGPKWCGPGKGANLGELKRELPKGVDIEEMVIVGCKTYGYRTNVDGYVTKSKGTKNPNPMKKKPHPKDEKYLDPEESYKDDCIEHDKNVVMFNKLRRFIIGEDARRTRPQKFMVNTISTSRARKVSKDMNIYEKTIEKKLTGIYTKGKVLKNGVIIPLLLRGKNKCMKQLEISEGSVKLKKPSYGNYEYMSMVTHDIPDDYDSDIQHDTQLDDIYTHADDIYPSDYDSDNQLEESHHDTLFTADDVYPSDYESDYEPEVQTSAVHYVT